MTTMLETFRKEPAPVESSYDATPYSINAFPQSTPDRLAVIAALFGLNAPPPDHCRVLELGCASGGNLLPMALMHPRSHFTGIDLSARQIAEGKAVALQLSLTNLSLQHQSILDVTRESGQFDYILAHGVYSWVPPNVQERILEICRDNLSRNGVAYISYNTYPGWHARGAIREMLWYHTEHMADPGERIKSARSLLAFLTQSIPATETAYSILIRQELALLMRTPDTYLLHEHLEQFNEPLYFHQFAARAAAKNLQYLGEAQIGVMVPARFGADVEKTIRAISPDLLHMEQYMDFLRNRMFRQSLLCHDDVPLAYSLQNEAVTKFHIASAATPQSRIPSLRDDTPETFVIPGSPKLTTSDPLMKAAMAYLSEIYPRSIPYKMLLAEARAHVALNTVGVGGGSLSAASAEAAAMLSTRLLNCYASNQIELSPCPPAYTTVLSSHPIASPYARLRAANGDKVTNLRLETVQLTEPSRLILTHLDGLHDRNSLVAIVTDFIENHPSQSPSDSPRERAIHYISQILPLFAKSALLIA